MLLKILMKLFPNLVIADWVQELISILIKIVFILILIVLLFYSGANWQKKRDEIAFNKYKSDQATAVAEATAVKQTKTDNFASKVEEAKTKTDIVYKTIYKKKVEYVTKNASSVSTLDNDWVWLYNASVCGVGSTSCQPNASPN